VASEAGDNESRAEASHGPRECMPCRGTGQVISNLGGTPSLVTCPWCGGRGQRLPDVDAQSGWLAKQAQTGPPGAQSAETPQVGSTDGPPDDPPDAIA
jgi:hypothetical protein